MWDKDDTPQVVIARVLAESIMPLNTISGYTKLIQQRLNILGIDDPEILNYINLVLSKRDELYELLNDLGEYKNHLRGLNSEE